MKFLVISSVLATVFLISATSASVDNNSIHSMKKNYFEDAFMKKLNAKCLQHDSGSCLMVKFVTYMNRMMKKSSIVINDSLQLTQTKEIDTKFDKDDEEMLARSAGSDEETLSVLAADKVWRFFNSRTLRWNIYNDADLVLSSDEGKLNFGVSVNAQRAFEEGRGKIKNVGPALIAAIATKVGILGALAFKGLVLLVGKAFLVSKLALVLALIIGLKKIFAKKHVTYEVVAHNTATHEHHHEPIHSTGWGRALDGFMDSFAETADDYVSGQNLAYSAQKQ